MEDKLFESSFDRIAQMYGDVRPAYPKQLFEDIRMNCKTHNLTNILEIGTGTGIATKLLLDFSLPITTIEPGENLLDIAKRNLDNEQQVTFIHSTFEEFEATKKYDLIFSATAFHWLDKELKYKKTNNILQDNGFLVLVWNNFLQYDSVVYHEINEVYKKYMSQVYEESDVNLKSLNKLLQREREISDSDLFYISFSQKYITDYVYTVENYTRLLNTFSEINKMKEPKRNLFLSEIKEIIKKHQTIHVPIMSSLYICRKKDSFSKIIFSSEL